MVPSAGTPASPAACLRAALRCGRLRRRPAAPLRPLVRSAAGERPAGIRAGMPPAGPSPVGGSLRSRRGRFRLVFAPDDCGGRKRPAGSGGCRYAPFFFFPLPSPAGKRGRKGKRGIAGFGRSRWSLQAPTPPFFIAEPHRVAVLLPIFFTRRHEPRSVFSLPEGGMGGDEQIISPLPLRVAAR